MVAVGSGIGSAFPSHCDITARKSLSYDISGMTAPRTNLKTDLNSAEKSVSSTAFGLNLRS